MSSFSSYLRVYEPISAFPPAERRRWETYVREQTPPDPVRGVDLERSWALLSAIVGPAPLAVDHAFVHRSHGVTYVCPWRTQLRAWQAMADFRRTLPDEIADAFIPRAAAEVAARELARWQIEEPELKTHIRSETWQVPLHWFVLFEGEERHLTTSGERSLSYLTSMADARRRLARALAVLRRTVDEGTVTANVEDLGRWLENYHHRSLVELDYGGLASLFDDDELEEDESVADIAHAVACLAAGDTEEAATAYTRVATRWGAVRAVEVSN